ncbi:MAG: cellulase family glycosylhydrolase [Clostridia bacterium]|nr:cellulase family glycosylhydrolase [Clostridia bacterium]
MKERWTCEQANEWYAKIGWMRGCNFIGSDCSNRLDMWQSYKCEEKLANAERELELCQKIGFNTVRLWANFDVYHAEPDSFMEILDRYVALCDKYGQKIMMVLAYEEDLPRGDVFVPKKLGEQPYAPASHQNRVEMTPEQKALQPKHYMEYPELRPIFLEMVQKIVRKYAKDERIFCWNIYNEPGIEIGDRSMELLKVLFATVRAEDPVQPLCADVWRSVKNGKIATPEEELALELSDVISFHSYQSYEKLVAEIRLLQKYNRPLFQTEWLHRINHNNVQEVYPLLYLANVSNYCWGFVVGKTQTHEPWPGMWEQWDRGEDRGYDFTKWQHDLFRPNLRPYDPREIALIEKFNRLATEEGR